MQQLNFYDVSFHKPVLSWNFKGVSREIIKVPRSNNNILSPITGNTFDHPKNKTEIYWKLSNSTSNHIYTPNNSKHLYCL